MSEPMSDFRVYFAAELPNLRTITYEEGPVTRWRKGRGERVEAGEPLVEIEMATQEVAAPASGTLVTILVAEGETAAVNTAIAVIEDPHG